MGRDTTHAVCQRPDGSYGRLDYAGGIPIERLELAARRFGYKRVVGRCDSHQDADAFVVELQQLLALCTSAGSGPSPEPGPAKIGGTP